MRRPFAPVLGSALVLAVTVLLAVPAAAADDADETTADLIVALKASPGPAGVRALVDNAAEIVQEKVLDDTLSTISVAIADVDDVTAELDADPRVAYVERDVVARIAATPGDPYYSQQWGTPLTQIPSVWDTTTGSSGVVIAVIDTGVNAAHPDLAGLTLVAGYDFVNGDTDPQDDNGHGTAAVGVISSQHNGIGTAGVCPQCSIMPLKAMGANGTGSHGAIASAIHHAVDNGADIINLSLGSEASTTTLHTAVQRAHGAGILVVAAAGNSGVETPFHPAAYPEVLGVAGSDPGDARYSWSNYGTWVSVAAPGCNFTAGYAPATNLLGYTNFCGTSSAAPLTAGVAGLLAAARPGASGPALTTALLSTASSVPYVSAGRINASAALSALTVVAEPPPTSGDDGGGGGGGGGGTLPPPPEEPAPVDEPDEEAPVESATSVTPSATSLAYGQTVELAGLVSTSAGSPQGAMVTLQSRAAGEDAWTDMAEQPADAVGRVLFTRQPQQTADYRLRFEGSAVQAASVSDVVTIVVRPLVTAAPPDGPVLVRRPVSVTGTVTPAQPGMIAVLQRRTATGWRDVTTGTTDAAGHVRLTTPARVGRTRYRVEVPATITLGAEKSPLVIAVGERIKIPRYRADARGDDRRNLNGEFIVLRNTGKTPIQLRGWKVRSASTRTTFALPKYRIPAGAKVKIHSGKGRNDRGHIYLNAAREVWRNRRDTAVVRHSTGPVAARVRW